MRNLKVWDLKLDGEIEVSKRKNTTTASFRHPVISNSDANSSNPLSQSLYTGQGVGCNSTNSGEGPVVSYRFYN